MDELATRGHVILLLENERVVLLRDPTRGGVRYVVPGASVRRDETPGRAAERAAQEFLGIAVEIDKLLFAATERGAEHFFFLASGLEQLTADWAPPVDPAADITPVILRLAAILGYPVEPIELARRLVHSIDDEHEEAVA